MSWLQNSLMLYQASVKLGLSKKNWKKESSAYLDPYLSQARKQTDGSISTGIFHKLSDYPLEALFAANMLASLANYKLSGTESKLISKAGAILALGDAYSDDTTITFDRMNLMLTEPHQADISNAMDHLFLDVYKDLLIELDDRQQVHFHDALMRGFEAEKKSRLLKNPDLAHNEVLDIIKNKGGVSLQIYRTLIHLPFIEGETNAIWEAGAFTQLADDLFDIPWDLRKHVQTSATICSSFEEIEHQLHTQYKNMVEALKQSALAKKDAQKFTFVFHIFLQGARAYIKQMKKYVGNELRTERILALTKDELKFRHFSAGNIAYVLPRTLIFNY